MVYKPSITDDMVRMNGYVLERLDRRLNDSQKQGGSVSIYIKACINFYQTIIYGLQLKILN